LLEARVIYPPGLPKRVSHHCGSHVTERDGLRGFYIDLNKCT
jgi:hypothetical protein